MHRDEILKILEKYLQKNREKYLIRKIGIFGSVARNDARKESDLDIVVLLDNQDLFHLIGIKQDLEEEFQVPVDIVSYRQNMNVLLKNRIDKDAVYV